MIHPVPVNAPEQQYAFDLAHIAALGGKASFLIRIGFVRFGYHGIAQPLTGILPEDAFAGNEVEFIPELAADTAVIPRLLLGLGRTAEIYDGIYDLVAHLGYCRMHILAHKNLPALGIDELAHLVHYIVIL